MYNNFWLVIFQIQDVLTKEKAINGMTIWASKSAFEEDIKGFLELGKWRILIIDMDLLQADILTIRDAKPSAVYVGGKRLK